MKIFLASGNEEGGANTQEARRRRSEEVAPSLSPLSPLSVNLQSCTVMKKVYLDSPAAASSVEG